MLKVLKIFVLPLLCFLMACISEPPKEEFPFTSKEEYENQMIESHKVFLKREQEKIKAFTDSLNLSFQRTGTGLHYSILEKIEGDSLRSGDIAVISYLLTDLSGDTLYQSSEGKLQEFAVDYDNVESGLHEGIKLMKVGEKAIFILPAHLAHGITGDQAAIKTQTTLVYRINLLAKR